MPVAFTVWWIVPLVLTGFLIGLLVTTFGGGGGFFYVPLLTLLFHVPTQYAVATPLPRSSRQPPSVRSGTTARATWTSLWAWPSELAGSSVHCSGQLRRA